MATRNRDTHDKGGSRSPRPTADVGPTGTTAATATTFAAPAGGDPRTERLRPLFESLRAGTAPDVDAKDLVDALAHAGVRQDDPRTAGLHERLAEPRDRGSHRRLDFERFVDVVRPDSLLIERVLRGDLVVPRFDSFRERLGELYRQARGIDRGKVADYIPQLGRVDPDQFGVAVTTIDGQRASFGDAATPFCVQSCCKPLNYILALQEHGTEKVHRHVGCEPSGRSFNELTLDRNGLPHNPLINAGAIMACALVQPGKSPADRFDHVIAAWTAACGGVRPGFSNPVYLSERGTADRNFALGYFMRENRAFPPGTDLLEVLEFYFQCCSMEATADSMSVLAATLASGGICPLTGERVFAADAVQHCLSLMSSCGMYDYSGQWAFSVGLPAKSGVAGGIFVVVPNVLGLCTWSPPLDQHGNSVRGIEFCRALVRAFNFHNFDGLVGPESSKVDPRRRTSFDQVIDVNTFCWAASAGDLSTVRRFVAAGACPDVGDYDRRTPLHLAASEGHLAVVDYLIGQKVSLSPVDRWGGTPLDDARRGGHEAVAELLAAHGAMTGTSGTCLPRADSA